MSKLTPADETLRRIKPLAKHHQAAFLRSQIAMETRGNIYLTSDRIRKLQAALQDIQTGVAA